MKLRQRIELEAKGTIGYSEAENKESFLVGVSVAFSKTEEHYEREIENLKKQIVGYKSMYENVNNDLKTLASIVNRYSENE
jgi:hypothetical protein